ncbi:PilZ domain-containing protein [Teredinibacter purpureus]|uniref:PilZ domain-containing protein n=1 Tax=Teredinibacter purpureus TaxID=2731756 RepID=UPI0005F7EABC|nr:PilZ domain-containing protein [Teredinibacter purpureus]
MNDHETSKADKPKVLSGRERRDFFRVDQDVIFDYKVVDAFAAENDPPEIEFEDSVSLSLLNELRRLDQDNIQTLRALTDKNRLLGDYLQTLSSKIDLIARHSLFAQDKEAGDKPKTRINLSEEGIAFIAERAVYKGNFLAMRLIFLPHYAPVVIFAKVIRCEPKQSNYQVAAKFHRLQDKDRQELSRQILKTQVSQKKATDK